MTTSPKYTPTAAAFLPAGSAPQWEALGFEISRRPFRGRVHHARKDGAHWSIDLDIDRANAWGTTAWLAPEDLRGQSVVEEDEPGAVDSRGTATPASGEGLAPFVRECLAAGFTLEGPPESDPARLGNRWLRWRDGRVLLAVTSSRTLVARGFVKHQLSEFSDSPGPAAAACVAVPERPFLTGRPHAHSGARRQSSLFA